MGGSNFFEIRDKRVRVDLGNDGVNRFADGFVNTGLAGLAHGLVRESYDLRNKDKVTNENIQHVFKQSARDAVEYGTTVGLYQGLQYAVEKGRDHKRDWVNGLVAGAVVGALYTLRNSDRLTDDYVHNAIKGAALGAASELTRDL